MGGRTGGSRSQENSCNLRGAIVIKENLISNSLPLFYLFLVVLGIEPSSTIKLHLQPLSLF